jgi:flavin reductase (DIM6/NTAB) family NADH-FMN oxidoreductase RutF
MPKRPWNQVDLPVYALTTTDGSGQFNMHLLTYVQAVSMQPKYFVCAIYEGTKSLELALQHPEVVLQVLGQQHVNLVNILGKMSGHNINKIQRLEKRKVLTQWEGFPVIADACGWIQLRLTPLVTKSKDLVAPDHRLFLGYVIKYKSVLTQPELRLNHLREKKLIRI